MPDQTYHLLIRGGTVATGRGAFAAHVAIAGETIAAIGRGLPAGARDHGPSPCRRHQKMLGSSMVGAGW